MVYLVGAGPGDPGLLTLRGKECLEKADVVIYDYLADPRILSFTKAGAERIYVGKMANQHTMPQDQISKLLARLGKEGKCVVRLKGGDPFVFGRGGEEALCLLQNGVPFEVVPGVTSAIAAPAYAGIPVTHRGVAASFAVVTGHEDPTKTASDIDWVHLAQATDTLIFLMGMENLANISQKLMSNGRTPQTPVALIRWGTRGEQRTLVTTLEKAAADAKAAAFHAPAVIVIGEVVRLREKLRWFDVRERRPLLGKHILVTRARAQASRLSERLVALGATVIETPAIRIEKPTDDYAALDRAICELATYDWLLLTSANGVAHFFARLFAQGLDARALSHLQVAAIGPATSRALYLYGVKADAVPQEYRAEGVIDMLADKIHQGSRILIARAEKAREILPQRLQALGAEVEVAPAYCTVAEHVDTSSIIEAFQRKKIDLVTFTSSSTVENLVHMLGNVEVLKQVSCAVIGPITAETCRKEGIEPQIEAQEYTIDGLLQAICAAFR